jgi:thymidine kinase
LFIEPIHREGKAGWIEVICGCMFSGKTEELIRRLNRAKIANLPIKVFKPKLDNRYHHKDIVSHNANSFQAISIDKSIEILSLVEDATVVGIDETQFFDNEIVEVCNSLANKGIRVIIAGLDMDYKGKPFGPMPYLLAVAEYVTKLHAICSVSGDTASFSYRKQGENTTILLGEKDKYEARSRKYFYE